MLENVLPKKIDSGCMEQAIMFLCAWIIVSVAAGYTIGISFWTIIASALAAWVMWTWVHEKKNGEKFSVHARNPLFALSALFLILFCGSIFWFVQEGFDLSADVAPVFASRMIQEKIPLTYEPYFQLPFLYPTGLPVLLSQLQGIGMQDYQWAWLFGLIGIILFAAYFISWTGKWKNEEASGSGFAVMLALALFLGSRLPYLSLWRGEYPLLLGLGLGMAALNCSSSSWKKTGIALGAAAMVHPYAGLVMGMGILVEQFVLKRFSKIDFTFLLKMGTLAFLVNIPTLLYQIIPLFTYSTHVEEAASVALLENGMGALSLIGLLSVGMALAGLVLEKLRGRESSLRKSPMGRIGAALFLAGILGYVGGMYFPQFVVGGKLLVLGSMGTALLGAATWTNVFSRMGKTSKGFSAETKWKAGSLVVLFLGMALLFSSMDVQKTIQGTKATVEEARAAAAVDAWLPENARVLFLSPGEGKMGEYSHTIPYDVVRTHYFTSTLLHTLNVEEAEEITHMSAESVRILKTACAECVSGLNVEYVVVNTRVFPHALPFEKVGETNAFVVYKKEN